MHARLIRYKIERKEAKAICDKKIRPEMLPWHTLLESLYCTSQHFNIVKHKELVITAIYSFTILQTCTCMWFYIIWKILQYSFCIVSEVNYTCSYVVFHISPNKQALKVLPHVCT